MNCGKFIMWLKLNFMIKCRSIILKIRTFIDNSADLLKTLILRSGIFFTTGTCNEIMWKYLFCHTTRYYIINVKRRIVLSCWMMKSADTHWENVPFNPFFFFARIITRTLLSVTAYVQCLLVFSILFACGRSICLLIHHISRCWTFLIRWCVE